MGTALAADPERASLPWLGGSCRDARYPALAGEWAVGCFGGEVNRAFHVETGQQVELERAVESPGLADGVLVGPTGRWVLPASAPSDTPNPLDAIAPFATDGDRIAVATAEGVVVLEDNRVHRVEAAPAPWRAPAVGIDFIAWVEGEDDIRLLVDGSERSQAWAEGRHVAADGEHIAWIEDERVCVQKRHQMKRCVWTDAHTARGLALDEGVACWEAWNGRDVDIACSDGFAIEGPGHQRGPSLAEGRLLYRDGKDVRLVTLPVAPPEAEPE